jgi:exosortase
VLGLFLIAAYAHVIAFTARVLISSEDMAQGLMAPFVAAYIAWTLRHKLADEEPHSPALGFGLLGVGALLQFWSLLAGSLTVSRLAFLTSMIGCVVLCFGRHGARVLAFPLALLLFTFPISPVLYAEVTGPMQLMASRLSESVFDFIGMTAVRDGNLIQLSKQTLSIVDACSGLRSLVTLLFFTLTYVYFFEVRRTYRVLVVLLSVPAAIVLNVARITVTGVLAEKVDPNLTHGRPHEILGWTCFFVGVLGIVAIHQLLMSRPSQTVAHTR